MKPARTLGLILACATLPGWSIASPPNTTSSANDCGVSSLFVLLKLMGSGVDISELEESLPTRHAEGYSMKELRDGAKAKGLHLRGVRLRSPVDLKTPAIVFLSDGRHGHYVVVRPVGPSGKLVQVIDPNSPPEVMDRQALANLPRWTGFALLPAEPIWPFWLFVGAVAIAATILLNLCGIPVGTKIKNKLRRVMASA